MKLVRRIIQEWNNLIYELRSRLSPIQPKADYTVPFVCQFSVPEHAELTLTGKLAPNNDEHWHKTGALSQERYAEWAYTMCGMASTAMALGYFHQKELKPAELAEDALRVGVYVQETDDLSSMKYREFAQWIKKYGLYANVYSQLSIRGIQHALSNKSLAIVSVNPNIRGYNTAPKTQKGGHLVLVTGYDQNKGTISINNPSGFLSTNTQVNHSMPIKEFRKFYAGRGIVLSPSR